MPSSWVGDPCGRAARRCETNDGGASHGHPLTGAFRTEEPRPAIRTLRTSTLAITEVMSRQPDVSITGRVPHDDEYVVTLHLRRRPPGSMMAEGRCLRAENFPSGNAGIVDLRTQLVSEYAGPAELASACKLSARHFVRESGPVNATRCVNRAVSRAVARSVQGRPDRAKRHHG
jgi:hypothetical protein